MGEPPRTRESSPSAASRARAAASAGVGEQRLLTCADGLPLRVVAHRAAELPDDAPLVVVCHGFKGFADWGFFPHLAEALAADGREVLRFDYSHNGTAPDSPADFTRLDLFERQTVSRHVADLGLVLDAFADGRRAWLVGHSMGGGVAVLRAARDERVAGLALLNGVSHARRVPAEGLAQLEALGRVEIPNARTGQVMPLGRPWFDDLETFDIERAARAVRVPALVLQGADDRTVLPEEGERLARWLPRARHLSVPDGDHTFGAKHPWQGWPAPLRAALEELREFLPASARP